MNKRKYILFLFAVVILARCNTNPNNYNRFSNPAQPNSAYPYLFSTGNQLYMSWITTEKESHTLHYSQYANNEWSTAKTIDADSAWFVNWADFPSIIADNSGPVAAHWLNKKPGGAYAYDVNIATFNETGNRSRILIPHDDNTATEHGFVSMIPWNEHSFLAVWLDGRQTDGRSDEEYYNIEYAMTLRGAIISRNGDIEKRFLIDDSVCDCCQTSLMKTKNGAVVAYRNRTDEEIRDIYTSRFNGSSWSEPAPVYNDNWKIGACPVNGPKLAADDSMVIVAWHTGANSQPAAKYAYSTDIGKSFSDPQVLNDEISLGRVDAEIVNGISYLSWMEKEDNKTVLKVASFDQEKQLEEPQTIATLNESRKTGFPQMELLKDELIFAWTQHDSSGTDIITRKMPIKR